MARVPAAWLPGLLAREARLQPELVVTLPLSYHPLTLPDKFGKVDGVDFADLATEVATILSLEPRRPSQQHPDVTYWIHTPRVKLLAVPFVREGVTLARLMDALRPDAGLPPIGSPFLRARLYELNDLAPCDLQQAYQAYQNAVGKAREAAHQAAFGTVPRSPSRQNRDKLDRQLIPAGTILRLVAKREEVVEAARADGVVAEETEPGDEIGQSAPDVLRIQLDTISGAFVEDTDVTLRPDGGEPLPAEIVDASRDVVLLRPKRASDLARLPRPGTRVGVLRQAEAKVDTAVAGAISRARQGAVVGDWDGLNRLLTSPSSLAPVPVPDGVPVNQGLSREQQDTVRRALATRHAFFIQGPPGTGKTTVITEIVRQLAERGERVLLAAPMHVAVDEVLSRLSDDPAIWALRVARDAGNVREELRHLREDAIRAGAVDQVKARLSRPNQEWPDHVDWLRRRCAALERLRAATDAHERGLRTLHAHQRSGQRAALEAEIDRRAAAAAGIMTEISRAESATAAARATADEAAPRLAQAEAHAAETAALLATLTAAVEEHQSRHAEAAGRAAAARQRLSETESELARLDARLADLRGRIERLREAVADGWRADVGSFRDYLAGQERSQAARQQADEKKSAGLIAAAKAHVAGLETRIADLERQWQQAQAQAGQLTAAAESYGRRAALAGDAAGRAEAAYQAARAQTGLFGKLGGGLGFGELAAKRSLVADWKNDQATAGHGQRRSVLAAARAQATADSAAALIAAAREDRARARRTLAQAAERRRAGAAAAQTCLAALARLRGWLAADEDLPATQATLDRVAGEAATIEALRDVAAASETAAAAIRTRQENTAAQLAAAEAELDRTRRSHRTAATQRTRQTADLMGCDTLVTQTRDLLAQAREPENAQAAAERQASETAAQVRADYREALAAGRQAHDSRLRLEAELADQTSRQHGARERLADVIRQHDEAAASADEADRRERDERQAALAACDGRLPDDLAADVAATPGWIDRIETLISLEARWRELVGAAGAADTDPTFKLGQAVLEATNLVCTTVVGIAGSPAARMADFDTLILDEASRVIDVDFLVPAVRARRWILVGDDRQLPPYVDQETEQHIHALLALRTAERDRVSLDEGVDGIAAIHDELVPGRRIRKAATVDLATRIRQDGSWAADYREHLGSELDRLGSDLAPLPDDGLPGDARHALITALALGQSVSLFERCVTAPGAAGTRARLTTQRRMIAPIAELVREPVYHGEYHTPEAAELARRDIRPFVGPRYREPVTFFDTQRSAQGSKLAGTGFVNEFEADLVVGVLHIWDQMAGRGGLPDHPSFSVLAFYKAQAALIERRLARRPLRRLRRGVIDSVDKIQGQESDLVVISFVRAQRTPTGTPARPRPGTGLWLQDIHRLNVAVTRARLALALVGDRPTLQRLSGDPEAEAFYANLFRLLDSGAPGTGYVADPVL